MIRFVLTRLLPVHFRGRSCATGKAGLSEALSEGTPWLPERSRVQLPAFHSRARGSEHGFEYVYVLYALCIDQNGSHRYGMMTKQETKLL